ncbi:winged helix-turn-helix transcriptional regulator [Dictyobacter arantiisoli]|uniref:Transcriptional regulator n=1 Tax=Dictyobacter arantiisoli TaxID=2014874 RepID=A0A5A5TKI5_9CHLR|nr:winged helix-turn-helix transcriptional regulator [Dictyobacter arantiisoli]GCF11596.1 transcriptional regulator [Dictyobacter arantiisoli]
MINKRSYHQYCSLAYALDLLGERWTLLIVRDLLLGPKRYKDLLYGLPGIGTNILAARLKELEQSNIIQRRVLPPPAGSTVYELTEYGQELDAIITAMTRWGAKSRGPRQPEQTLRPVTLVLELRENFNPEAAHHIQATYELCFEDNEIYTLQIANGVLEVKHGIATNPNLVVMVDVETFFQLRLQQCSTEEALAAGTLHLSGNPDLFPQFLDLFSPPTWQSPAFKPEV